MQSVISNARVRMLWFGAGLCAAAVAACGKDPASPAGKPVDAVVVSPQTASVPVGSSVSLEANVLDANGEVISSSNVAWASEDTTIARVSQNGIVTGVRQGTVQIAASAWGKNGVATITVSPGVIVLAQVGRIAIAPTNPRISEGQSVQLTASVLDVQERVISGLVVTWSSSNTAKATVDNTGLVHGISNGTVTITASAGGKTGSTTVRIDR